MKKLTNRLISLVLAFLMLMSGMPTALAEEVETLPSSTEKTTPTDLSETSEPDAADISLTDIEQAPVEEMPEVPVDEEVSVEATDQTEQSVTNDPSESSEPTPQTVREFIDANGYAYAQLRKDGSIFAEEVMQTLIYTTNQAGSAILCTGYTQTGLMTVWLMSADREIITGWMEEACLEDAAITESQAAALMQQGEPAEADTPAGKHPVYEVNGNKPVSEAEPIVDVPSEEIPAEYPPAEEPTVEEPPVNELLTEDTPSEETPSEDVPLGDLPVEEIPTDEHPTEQPPVVSVPDDEHPIDEQPVEDQPIEELPTEDLPSEELPIEELPAEEQPSEELLTEELPAEELPIEEEMPQPEPLHQIGDYLAVTTDTRVFEQVGEYEELEFCDWMGYFMRDAIVQVLAIQTDEYARTWYQVEYLFGAEGADSGWNWTDTANLWILADEALPTEETHLTVTDYAFWQKPDFNSGIMLLAATPMPGFSLRNISVNLGGFYAWQSGLHGSSGRDSAYLQIAKSAGHGTIYATPHYLEGYTVFCLEHTMDGPGEGNGSTPTGPYVLVDMDTYCNTSTGDGVTGYRFSEPTMHAIGWILRHTYPFMVLDRSDKDNNSWSRVAGQFAMNHAQQLYEKKLITYPRTDSRFLPNDLVEMLPGHVKASADTLPSISSLVQTIHPEQVIDDSKITDHHAIIPTRSMPKQMEKMKELPTGERDILNLVIVRLACAVSEPCVYDESHITLTCADHAFTTKGKHIVSIGWKAIQHAFGGSIGEHMKDENGDMRVPQVIDGQTFNHVDASVKEGQTTPPSRYTEDTLLSAMECAGAKDMPEDTEHKGIGTPATRAGTLEKLVHEGLIQRSGSGKTKHFVPTSKGTALVAVVPQLFQSAAMTADWEQRLKQIEHGTADPQAFMEDIVRMLREMTRQTQRVPDAEVLFPSQREKLGSCPACGSAVSETPKGFFCENRTCHFGLWKDNRLLTGSGKKLTAEMVEALLHDGAIQMNGLISKKTGKPYNATLLMEWDEDGTARFRMAFN